MPRAQANSKGGAILGAWFRSSRSNHSSPLVEKSISQLRPDYQDLAKAYKAAIAQMGTDPKVIKSVEQVLNQVEVLHGADEALHRVMRFLIDVCWACKAPNSASTLMSASSTPGQRVADIRDCIAAADKLMRLLRNHSMLVGNSLSVRYLTDRFTNGPSGMNRSHRTGWGASTYSQKERPSFVDLANCLVEDLEEEVNIRQGLIKSRRQCNGARKELHLSIHLCLGAVKLALGRNEKLTRLHFELIAGLISNLRPDQEPLDASVVSYRYRIGR